jgi:hypothetical protein
MEKKGEAKRLFLSLFIAIMLCVGLISISYAASSDDSQASDSIPSLVWGFLRGLFRFFIGEVIAGDGYGYNGGPVCGNNVVEAGEDCEPRNQGCCGSICQFIPASAIYMCRDAESGRACDLPDYCPGGTAECPDQVLPDTAVCRNAAADCDIAENCDGTSKDCPQNKFKEEGTLCRPVEDPECDTAEYCTGSTASCPLNTGAPDETPCGESPSGDCDLQDVCLDTECASKVKPYGEQCYWDDTSKDCDKDSFCTGSGASCPPHYLPSSVECRPAGTNANDADCDVAEYCTGSSDECPLADYYKNVGDQCGTAPGVCKNWKECDGNGNCIDPDPPNKPVDTPCGGQVDQSTCTDLDRCDGAGYCADSYLDSGECRAETECKYAAYCDGTAGCPASTNKPEDWDCGEDHPENPCHDHDICVLGYCYTQNYKDQFEVCVPEGSQLLLVCEKETQCDANGNCNIHVPKPGGDTVVCSVPNPPCKPSTEYCDGQNTVCPGPDDPPPAVGEDCADPRGPCDQQPVCVGYDCNYPGPYPYGTVCASSGCGGTICDGKGFACQYENPDLQFVLPNGTVCRDAVDVCDLVEKCTGTSPLCPFNTYKEVGVLCAGYLCSNTGGGDNAYNVTDFKLPSQGYCDGIGSCDWAIEGVDSCDLAEGTTQEGTNLGVCEDEVATCIDTCTDTLDNDNDGCTDSTDSDCGGSELGNCDDTLDNDCDGLTDEFDPDCFECTPGATQDCGSGTCAGTQTCVAGFWADCTTKVADCGTCCICEDNNNPAPQYDETQDSDCSVYDCDPLDEACTDYNDVQYCKGINDCADANEDCNDYSYEDEFTVCAGYLCSNTGGGDNAYNAGDFRLPSQGYCDNNGNCDFAIQEVGSCLAEGSTQEGTNLGVCIDDTATCIDTCTDTLDNDNDGCADGIDVDCGGIETSCDGLDDNCNGVIDEGFTNENCQYVCQNNGYVWTNNGGTLNCCGNDAGEDNPYQSTETNCNDGNDNDCDGLTDYNDPDCDSDGDGVPDDVDMCPGTTYWETPEGLRPNHYDSSNMDLTTTYGCSGEQILFCKPGANNGELTWGMTPGTLNVWISQTGWSLDCQVNGIVALEGEQKALLENTDGDILVDIIDFDNDNDGIVDSQDSEPESTPAVAGQQGTGKPDWWCEKHPGKC